MITKLLAGPVLRRTGFRTALLVNGVLAVVGCTIVGWFGRAGRYGR